MADELRVEELFVMCNFIIAGILCAWLRLRGFLSVGNCVGWRLVLAGVHLTVILTL